MALTEFLLDVDRRRLDKVIDTATDILSRPVDLAYTDHTIKHKQVVRSHLDSFVVPWVKDRLNRGDRPDRISTELLVLLSATYLHDIGMQMVKPEVLASLPSLTDAEREEARRLPPGEITEAHRQISRRLHHKIAHDWIASPHCKRESFPSLSGVDGVRLMVAKVVWAHNIWLNDPEAYGDYKNVVAPSHQPEGDIRVHWLSAFLRLADILDQDKRRVDLEAAKRLPVPPVSMVHWWRHHYVNACRLGRRDDDGFPLTVAFRLPDDYKSEREWLVPALHSATVGCIEAEQARMREWLGPNGIHIRIPDVTDCHVEIDPDAVAMPPEVMAEFRKTWPQAAAAARRADLHNAAEDDTLTAKGFEDAYAVLVAGREIDEYLRNVRARLDGDVGGGVYSPLELRVSDEVKSALDHLGTLLRTQQVQPHPIVVVGAPGGGKTTLLRRYVWEWSSQDKADPLPIYVQATRFGSPDWAAAIERRLPSLEHACSDAELAALDEEILRELLLLIERSLAEIIGVSGRQMAAVVQEILARRTCVILFDGINELPPVLGSLAAGAVRVFLASFSRHRVVVTSRTGDFRPGAFPQHQYCELMPMSEAAVRQYWEDVNVPAAAVRRFFAGAPMGVRELVRTPMAAYMTGELLKLPDPEPVTSAGRLFQRYVREVLRRWRDRYPASRLDETRMRALLGEIAFTAFRSGQVSFSPILVRLAIHGWLAEMDAGEAADLRGDQAVDIVATGLLDEVISTGFLQPVGGSDDDSGLRFRHHTLQDYFAAVAIPSRIEQLPKIVAMPVFHEAIGMVVGLADDPGGFIRRLCAATSEDWGFTQLLPLLFRVIGEARVPVEADDLLRVFAGAAPLYSAAVGILSPFAAETLCHLFAQVDWSITGSFLAFIAGDEARPEWEREPAGRGVVFAMSQKQPPSPEALRPLFWGGIPPEVAADYETAKNALATGVDQGGDATSFARVPLMLAGLTASTSFNIDTKFDIAGRLARCSPHQLGSLQAVFIEECCVFGAMDESEHELVRSMIVNRLADLILRNEDIACQAGQTDYAKGYRAAWGRIHLKLPLLCRLVGTSADVNADDRAAVLELIAMVEAPPYPIRPFSRQESEMVVVGSLRHMAGPVLDALRDLASRSANPFLVHWLGEIVPGDPVRYGWSRLEPAVVAAGAAGYFLWTAHRDLALPAALARYHVQPAVPPPEILVDLLLRGDTTGFVESVATRGLTEAAIAPCLKIAAATPQRLEAVVEAIAAIDNALGWAAKCEALVQAAASYPAAEIDRLVEKFAIPVEDLLEQYSNVNIERKEPIIAHLARIFGDSDRLPRDRFARRVSYLVYVRHALGLAEAISVAVADGVIEAMLSEPGARAYVSRVVELARELHPEAGVNPDLDRLTRAIAPRLRKGGLADWFRTFAVGALRRGEVSAEAVRDTLVAVLDAPSPQLDRHHRKVLFDVLQSIDDREFHSRLDRYLALCPIDTEAAASDYGNAGWSCYRVGDDDRFLDLTERALLLAPGADWLLGNRAFALYLLGRPRGEVMDAYARAVAATPDRQRWHKVAVEDLEHHPELRSGAAPVPADLIKVVDALGRNLADASPPPEAEDAPSPA